MGRAESESNALSDRKFILMRYLSPNMHLSVRYSQITDLWAFEPHNRKNFTFNNSR